MNKDMMIILCTVVPIVLIVVPLGLWWEVKRSTSIVRKWAEANAFTLNATQFRWVRRGPYSGWATATWQAVHRIRVTDSTGREISGWMQIKDLYGKGNSLEVKWDDSPTNC